MASIPRLFFTTSQNSKIKRKSQEINISSDADINKSIRQLQITSYIGSLTMITGTYAHNSH